MMQAMPMMRLCYLNLKRFSSEHAFKIYIIIGLDCLYSRWLLFLFLNFIIAIESGDSVIKISYRRENDSFSFSFLFLTDVD